MERIKDQEKKQGRNLTDYDLARSFINTSIRNYWDKVLKVEELNKKYQEEMEAWQRKHPIQAFLKRIFRRHDE